MLLLMSDIEIRVTRLEAILETVLPTLATKADVSAAIAEVKTDLIKVTLTGLAIAVGILIFAINRALPPQNPQPIVIYAPQQAGPQGSATAPSTK
jgi:hypothetical protein